jgi:Lipid A 3-O-deacylase (PagL)
MKQIAFIVFALLCINFVSAQIKGRGVELGFGVDGGVPVGNDLKQYTSWGFGGDATLGYNFDQHAALLVRGGYMSFVVKNEYQRNKLKAIGDGFMKLCGRYNFPGPFYIEPQVGFSSFSSGKSHEVKPGSGFTYAIAAGLFLDKLKAFEVSLRYEATTGNNGIDFVGLRIAYSIKPGTF